MNRSLTCATVGLLCFAACSVDRTGLRADELLDAAALPDARDTRDGRPTTDDAAPADAGGPPASCAEILARDPSAPDGQYVIVVGTEERTVTCDMTSNGGGWTEAVDLDVSAGCPGEWDFDSRSGGCWIDRPSCEGESRAFFVDAPIAEWSELRGFVRGYQFQTPDGFDTGATSLDDHYVDGVSITTGMPRRHLWTLGVGLYQPTGMSGNSCPCDNGPAPPAIVGTNWTCETGNDAPTYVNMPIWYLDDLLWDGDAHVAGCAPASPWFVSPLATPSRDPIEVRIMVDQCDDNLAIVAMRLFVR